MRPSFALAEDDVVDSCVDVENDAGLGPVRNQGDIAWSYAFAAADLLSFRLHQKISAMDLAIGYNATFLPSETSIGEKLWSLYEHYKIVPVHEVADYDGVAKAVKVGQERGFCGEDLMPSDIPMERFKTLDKSETLKDTKNWLDVSEQLCKDKRVFDRELEAREIFPADGDDLEPLVVKIDEILDGGSITAISYDHRFIYGTIGRLITGAAGATGNFAQLKKRQATEIKNGNTTPYHASLVVGRRRNPQTQICEYKVRMSVGTACEGIRADLCSEGNLWLSREDLKSHLYSLTYLP